MRQECESAVNQINYHQNQEYLIWATLTWHGSFGRWHSCRGQSFSDTTEEGLPWQMFLRRKWIHRNVNMSYIVYFNITQVTVCFAFYISQIYCFFMIFFVLLWTWNSVYNDSDSQVSVIILTVILHVHLFCAQSKNISMHIPVNEAQCLKTM